MEVTPDILLVIATIVGIFSFSSIVAGWTVRRWPILALISFLIAAGLFAYVHVELTDGIVPLDIPNAFITVAARILN
ncbi:hypothetical protein [Hasllibacter sp. MH4015]|uniref:hypothetical protein n=1 Tax=Hasllibacter sp. MH4015 TaxID=2854029 RepID=UPI001CD5D6AE|nr:hypothetical protein [Hasllibacter sp. MH4015]